MPERPLPNCFSMCLNKGWRMVYQKLWVSQNFSRISRVSQSRFFKRLCASRFLVFYMKVSNTLKSRSRNLKSQNVSGSQRKTLVSPSRKVSHLPFATPSTVTRILHLCSKHVIAMSSRKSIRRNITSLCFQKFV